MGHENITPPADDRKRRAYGLDELEAMLPVGKEFLRREAARGKLRVTRLGRRVVVLAEDLDSYLRGGRVDA